ncbi:unnamed protein product [Staurois parvus]|uniref:Uncharacterized protein n=1 Tax=Staurois parvus TaxID=386267 RepID=A0ABN9HRP1_9NEOB|nr:unnamed protein product [Staurois parvus]
MSSKVSRDSLREAVGEVLLGARRKKRKFLQSMELQISLKNYDLQKDKRFSGTLRLKSTPKPKFSSCISRDQKHCDEAKAVDLPNMDIEALKKLNKKLGRSWLRSMMPFWPLNHLPSRFLVFWGLVCIKQENVLLC